MADNAAVPILPTIIAISKLDVQIALLQAQIKKVDDERKLRAQALTALTQKKEARAKLLADKKALSAREEKGVRLERERINERRRALSTLNNYKLQQAAEREIDFVAKQIGQREDLLLGLMREVELLEKDIKDIEASLQGMQDECAVFEKTSAESLETVRTRLTELQTERVNQVQLVGNNQFLALYNRIKDKFPSDPVVDVVNRDSCSGCHMKLGPQVPVQISRGDVVKCPGCGRILKLPTE